MTNNLFQPSIRYVIELKCKKSTVCSIYHKYLAPFTIWNPHEFYELKSSLFKMLKHITDYIYDNNSFSIFAKFVIMNLDMIRSNA